MGKDWLSHARQAKKWAQSCCNVGLTFIQQIFFKLSIHCVTGTGIVLGGMMVNKTVPVIVELRRV